MVTIIHLVLQDSIDDPVGPEQRFAQVGPLELRHLAATLRKFSDLLAACGDLRNSLARS